MRVPLSTYRIQFNSSFGFADADRLVPYLHTLGISHLYCSPLLQARSGSLHGYDVTDPTRLSADLGSEEEFCQLARRLRQHGMGLLLDIVPNHMAASPENPWWMDVFEHGKESAYARYFDIDWESPGSKSPPSQRDRVVWPVLSDLYDRVLTDQRIALRFCAKGFRIEAEGNPLPVNPKTYGQILAPCVELLRNSPRPDEQSLGRAEQVLRSCGESAAESSRSVKSELWQLYRTAPAFRSALDETVWRFNGTKGEPGSFEKLHSLLECQVYRLAYWRNASEEVNYRRFFGLNDLVALRIEAPQVFDDSHSRIRELVAQGHINGLRIDHIDGLRDPLAYLERLQNIAVPHESEPSGGLKIYTIVEKITSGRETLASQWPTAGTTGYDYLNVVNTLFIDAAGLRDLEAIYRDFTGIRSSFAETWNVRKKQVMEDLFASDVRRLSWRLGRLAALDRLGRDIPMRELVRGLKELTACLPIYRTYCRGLQLSERDRGYLERAFEIARDRAPAGAVSDVAFAFLKRVFLLMPSLDLPNHPEAWLDFLLSWQQFTGAVMAKGLEDTAFFVHHGLISLNEVGCNPLRKEIGFGVTAFHRFNQRAFAEHPFTLNATSTHDTKWSEDVRARINVLSEIPAAWKSRLDRWFRWNQAKRAQIDGRAVPSPNEELLLYQSMLGIWPIDGEPDDARRAELRDRLQAFLRKAAREAKTHSNWVSPNQVHENALRQFLCAILEPRPENRFLCDFCEFVERIAPAGAANAWSQVLLKITSPGVPDFFQGNELWNPRLTDPDNRNAVDFSKRLGWLGELDAASPDRRRSAPLDLLSTWKDGRLKLYLTWQALNFRRANPDLFLRGEYLPLESAGEHRQSVCAFARRFEQAWALVAVPRLASGLARDRSFPLGSAWGSTTIGLPAEAPSSWKGIFTAQAVFASQVRRKKSLSASAVFSLLPFALLIAQP